MLLLLLLRIAVLAVVAVFVVIQSLRAFRRPLPMAKCFRGVVGSNVDGLVNRGGEGPRGRRIAQEGQRNEATRSARGTTWTVFGASKGSVLRLGGGLGVRLGTLWGTLGGKGTTFEPQGFEKWVPSIGVAHSGTILELPGWIWGAILGSFWGLFGYFFCRLPPSIF